MKIFIPQHQTAATLLQYPGASDLQSMSAQQSDFCVHVTAIVVVLDKVVVVAEVVVNRAVDVLESVVEITTV